MSKFARALFVSPSRLYAAGAVSLAGAFTLGYYVSRTIVPENLSHNQSTLPLKNLTNPEYATSRELKIALDKIKAAVGSENVSAVLHDLISHSDSTFQYRHPKPGEIASAVVYAHSAEQVSEVLKICHELKVPLVPYSGGTSLEGHYIPIYQGISLDLSGMDKIVRINPKDMDIIVQPGVTWEDINEEADKYNLRFGPDPGPSAMIGGMAGTNASGTNALAMGTMRQNVVGLTVVLADGTIVRTRRRPRKSSAGYSLTDLFIGSEGTLGVIVEATVKLHAKPKVTRVGALSFPGIREASGLVEAVLQSGYRLDAMELMDDEQMRLLNLTGITSRNWDEKNTLLVRFAGPSQEHVDREIAAVSSISKKFGAISLVFANSEEEGRELWAARKNSLFSVLHSAPKGYQTLGTDTAVPISQLSRFVEETHDKIKEMGILGSILGHVGDGNFHVCLAYDPNPEELRKVHEFADWCAHKSISLEGTCTGEHGIGMGKRLQLLEELGEPAIDLMRQIKHALDPKFILNPGKVFSIQPFNDLGDTPTKPLKITEVS